MSLNHIIESWRDEEYRENLDGMLRAQLPVNPAGEVELADAVLAGIDGALPMPPTVSEAYGCTGTIISFVLGC